MQLAVNYSYPTADLLRDGRIKINRFKLPAWPDLIVRAQAEHPAYVHFPLKVGAGIGDAVDTEKNQRADWNAVEMLMKQTDTPFINLHLAPQPHDYPDVPINTRAPAHVERMTERLIADVHAVVARFGTERVIAENCFGDGSNLRAAILPSVIRQVIEETGCGLLFDLSHARLAADELGMDARAYIAALPMARLREMHVTGIQCVDERWISRVRDVPNGDTFIQRYAGRMLDHLPMTDADWDFLTWALDQIRGGAWGEPWVVSYEYGGIGGVWEAISDADTLAADVPRLYEMVHAK